MSWIFQLRTRHIPLEGYLVRFNSVEVERKPWTFYTVPSAGNGPTLLIACLVCAHKKVATKLKFKREGPLSLRAADLAPINFMIEAIRDVTRHEGYARACGTLIELPGPRASIKNSTS